MRPADNVRRRGMSIPAIRSASAETRCTSATVPPGMRRYNSSPANRSIALNSRLTFMYKFQVALSYARAIDDVATEGANIGFCFFKSYGINCAGSVFDDGRVEAAGDSVACGIVNAIVGGESANIDVLYAAFAKVACQARRLLVTVIIEAAVAVDAGISSLAEDCLDTMCSQLRMKCRAVGFLYTVIGPQNLFQSLKCSLVKRLFALVLGSETLVVGRMPVLRCNNQLELFGQLVYYGNDLLTVTDFEFSSGDKVVLNVYDNERTHINFYIDS